MWLEHCYRNGHYGNFFSALPYIIVPILISQYGLYNGFKLSPSLFTAGIVFTVVNTFLRIINSYRLHETIGIYQWIAILMMLIAAVLIKIK